MGTSVYGPLKVTQEWTNFEIEFEVEYQSTADVMSIHSKLLTHSYGGGDKRPLGVREQLAGFDYSESRAVGELVTRWYLQYVLGYFHEDVSTILSRKASIVERPK